MFKILYDSGQIRKEIIRIFSNRKSRRIAISAFVGNGANSFLPYPRGIILYCWPQPGGTNPNILRGLIKSGVKVFFADRLHAKVYWTDKGQAIITSANLSRNALGIGNLLEFGVLIDSKKININKIITSLHAYQVTDSKLQKLDVGHDKYWKKNKKKFKNESILYINWYEYKSPKNWKLGWWDTIGAYGKKDKEKAFQKYNVYPCDYISCKRKDYSQDDWVLVFYFKDEKIKKIDWLYVDFINLTSKTEKKAYEKLYPYHAVQATPLKDHSSPPFQIDKKFQIAFKRAVSDYGFKNIKTMIKPSKKFKDLIYKYYKKQMEPKISGRQGRYGVKS